MSECPEASAMRLEVLEVLINMSAQSKEEDGSVQPSHAPIIVHSGQRVRPAEVFGRLLQPGELILFLEKHAEGEFEWETTYNDKQKKTSSEYVQIETGILGGCPWRPPRLAGYGGTKVGSQWRDRGLVRRKRPKHPRKQERPCSCQQFGGQSNARSGESFGGTED
jgi:hypothetical protein